MCCRGRWLTWAWTSLKESEVWHITTGNPLDHLRPGSRLKVASGSKSKADAYSILHLRQIVGSRALSSIFSAKHGDLGQVVVKVIQSRYDHSELRVPRLAREWVREQGVLRQLKHVRFDIGSSISNSLTVNSPSSFNSEDQMHACFPCT